MNLFSHNQRKFANCISKLAFCNPFSTERISLEQQALGDDFVPVDPVLNLRKELQDLRPNVEMLISRVTALTTDAVDRLKREDETCREDMELYLDLVLFLLYHAYVRRFYQAIKAESGARGTAQSVSFYGEFRDDFGKYLASPRLRIEIPFKPDHLFACFFQLARAFHYIFGSVIGSTMVSANLRSAIWESVFTHDMRRYLDVFHRKMGDMSTLISGPSGTGKELVARAIGLSRYVPYDEAADAFQINHKTSFYGLNLSALSPTLIESELFGHSKAAFTGAAKDRIGWLEACGEFGSVFLDEIGEISMDLQVKLLRVLQDRTLYRLGETEPREFKGKIIAATNRNLREEMDSGRFREDLYYRLCSDMITTPSLREQLLEAPDELTNIVQHVVRTICGPEHVDKIAPEVSEWIESNLGADYEWPGNFREMEQCIRNLLIHKTYVPSRATIRGNDEILKSIQAGEATADELLSEYCTLVYLRTKSYEKAARILKLDRRTVRKRVDPVRLRNLGTGK